MSIPMIAKSPDSSSKMSGSTTLPDCGSVFSTSQNHSARLRRHRKTANMTQERLGELANLNPKYIGEVERTEKPFRLMRLPGLRRPSKSGYAIWCGTLKNRPSKSAPDSFLLPVLFGCRICLEKEFPLFTGSLQAEWNTKKCQQSKERNP
jgi:transcriptional regulator with XRE-family HTH domain